VGDKLVKLCPAKKRAPKKRSRWQMSKQWSLAAEGQQSRAVHSFVCSFASLFVCPIVALRTMNCHTEESALKVSPYGNWLGKIIAGVWWVGGATFDKGLSVCRCSLPFWPATVSADWLSWLQVATDLTVLTFIIVIIWLPVPNLSFRKGGEKSIWVSWCRDNFPFFSHFLPLAATLRV